LLGGGQISWGVNGILFAGNYNAAVLEKDYIKGYSGIDSSWDYFFCRADIDFA